MPTAARAALVGSLSALVVGALTANAHAVVSVAVSDAFATPGTSATVAIAVSGGNGKILDVALDVLFDEAGLDITTADCTIAPRLTGTHTLVVFLPSDPAPPGEARLRLGLFDTMLPLDTFADGEIATCTFSIDPGVALGAVFPLTLDPAHLEVIDASTPPRLLDSMGTDGSITAGEGLATLCPGTPRAGCRSASKTLLVITDKSADKKDKLTWKWIKGAATTRAEFADPTTFASYGLCIYAGDALRLTFEIGPSSTSWKAIKHKGFKYLDKSGAVEGLTKVVLKSGAEGKAKAVVTGKGVNLPDLGLGSLPTPIRAQLFNSSSGVCWEGIYDDAAVIKNSAKKLKAKVSP